MSDDDPLTKPTIDAVLYAVGVHDGELADEVMYQTACARHGMSKSDFYSCIGWLAGTRRIEPDGGWISARTALLENKWRVVPLMGPPAH